MQLAAQLRLAGPGPSPRPEVLRQALFPPPFNAQRDDLDSYIEGGLELAADAERRMV